MDESAKIGLISKFGEKAKTLLRHLPAVLIVGGGMSWLMNEAVGDSELHAGTFDDDLLVDPNSLR